ncbi:MAG: trigger factor [Geminicoccaceae bacterium]
MQVTQVAADGLKREFKVVVPAGEIESRVKSRLERLVKTVRVPGFRPGKAPLSLLKKQYGRAVMGEVLEEAVDQGSRQALEDGSLKPALRPKVEVTSFDEGKDLEFNLGVEVLPEVPAVELEGISLTRLVAEPEDERVEKGIENLAKARTKYAAPAEPRPAADGDQVVIDFEGFVDGVAFEGGKGEAFRLNLGSGTFIPGFEAQLVGAAAGEARDVNVTFPADYGKAELAGKAATFKVKVSEVLAPEAVTVDDAWATSLGFEDLADMRKHFRERVGREFANAGRLRLKRALLDHLAAAHDFPVPTGMVDLEFDAIWKQLTDEMQRTGQTFEGEGQTEEQAKAEYRAIAERRVRLGLILSDIGTKNEVRVEPQELQQAVIAQAQRFPGQERQVFEYFQKNAAALEQVRAPLFEDKVVDFIIARAKVEEKTVTPEELLRDPEDEAADAAAAKTAEA